MRNRELSDVTVYCANMQLCEECAIQDICQASPPPLEWWKQAKSEIVHQAYERLNDNSLSNVEEAKATEYHLTIVVDEDTVKDSLQEYPTNRR